MARQYCSTTTHRRYAVARLTYRNTPDRQALACHTCLCRAVQEAVEQGHVIDIDPLEDTR